jgi:hypothetical protein
MRRKDMPLVPDHGTSLAARRLAEEAVSVEPWNFWDPPFTYRTDKLPTFLLFLTDAAARELKATHTTADSMTLRLTDGESELFYTAYAGELVANGGRGLCRMLEHFPRQTPEPARQKLAGHAARFFFGGSRL